jgi:SAM-dependent methyltransferase
MSKKQGPVAKKSYKEQVDEIDTSRAISEPTEADFDAVRAWGMVENPFAAVDDYSDLKAELRWLNAYQRAAHMERFHQRAIYYQQQRTAREYYSAQDRPISRNKRNFLILKKSWYIIPLEWDRFAESSCHRILDFGCGDGDALQRVANHIAKKWEKTGYPGHRIELVGIDLNPTRIKNAQTLSESPHEMISFNFKAGDIGGTKLDFEDNHFSYGMMTGVIELFNEDDAQLAMAELCRICELGLYVEDLYDDARGAYVRRDFSYLLEPHGFQIEKHHWVFTEPFTLEGTKDPLGSSPILVTQVFFAVPHSAGGTKNEK